MDITMLWLMFGTFGVSLCTPLRLVILTHISLATRSKGGEATQYCTTFTLSSSKAWQCSLLVSLSNGLGNVLIVLSYKTSLHKIGEDRTRGHLIFGIGC